MHDCIDLGEFKSQWHDKLLNFKKKLSKLDNDDLTLTLTEPEISVDDLINPPKDEKIERQIEMIIDECQHDPLIKTSKKKQIQTIKECDDPQLQYVQELKENIDSVRDEPILIGSLLATKSIVKAEDLEEELKQLTLHSYKDFDQKAKLKPIEKNHLVDPIGFYKEYDTEQSRTKKLQQSKETDILINISIYHALTGKKYREFIVLGKQTLFHLKDQIYCVTDKYEQKDQGSFFFIENCFYDDIREGQQARLSDPIVQEQKKTLKKEYGQQFEDKAELYQQLSMQDTKFEDMKLSLGKPYIYRHQGSCDHMMIVNDIRVRNKDDITDDQIYPLTIFEGKMKRRRCDGCFLKFAVCMCFNDKIQDQNPSYFCDECYKNIHFNPDHTLKMKDYQLYYYFHE